MGEQIKTKAIVIHEMPIGDYDKRLLLLTKEYGKVTVFVKNAKRPKNKLLAASQIFAYGDYILNKGRNSYYIYQADIIECFHHLQKDIEDLTYGMFFLEFVNYVSQEEMSNQSLMYLLLMTLKAVGKENSSNKLIVQIFSLRAMVCLGLSPWTKDCIVCHKEQEPLFFSSELGGIICENEGFVKDRILINRKIQIVINDILTNPIRNLFSIKVSEEDLIILTHITGQFMDNNLNHRFSTLDFLETL